MTQDRLRPLPELAPFIPSLLGIFCDLDDTLTHAGSLVPEAYAGLAACVEAGLRVIVATGRPLGWADTLSALWPVNGVVAENGGAAVIRQAQSGKAWGRTIYWRSDAERADDGRRLAALRDQILGELPYARLAADQWLRQSDVAFDVGEQLSLDGAQIDAIATRIRAAGADCLVSSVHAHASFGGADKARMLRRLGGELWGDPLPVDRYLFVGDSPNDQAGFAAFPLSVGVANVARYVERLAPPPRFITLGSGGHGFAELARFVLANR